MTRTGAARSVDRIFSVGRLKKAMAFHRAVETVLPFHEDIGDVDVLGAMVVLAAIAYADAVTGVTIGKVNQKDHAGAPRLLRDALGERLPGKQLRNLERILGTKDEVHYGARSGRGAPQDIVRPLQEFADWARDVLAQQGVSTVGE